jgi:hypothetical protein
MICKFPGTSLIVEQAGVRLREEQAGVRLPEGV